MHPDASLPLRERTRIRRPKRLLALQGDARLVDHVRAGDGAAFEVLYERHVGGILSFSRHMLGSQHEAEDAVQQAFVAAHRDMLQGGREIAFKPWLYTIARNRCLSMLRARREQATELPELSTAGLHEEVAHRSDLRELVADLQRLPAEQREALVLSELGDLSHAEIAEVLGSGVANVKGLIFRARSAMIERRDARAADCAEIRAELSTATGGGLRRSRLRYHLESCSACAAYREEVRRQRKLLGVVLPVVPSIALHEGVMASVGLGAASAGAIGAGLGGAASAGGAAGSAASVAGTAAVGAPLIGGTLAKVAIVGLLAGTAGVVATEAVRDDRGDERARDTRAEPGTTGGRGVGRLASPPPPRGARAAEKSRGVRGAERRGGKRGSERSARGLRRAGQGGDGAGPRGKGRAKVGPIRGQGRTDGSKGQRGGRASPPPKAGSGGKPPSTGSGRRGRPAEAGAGQARPQAPSPRPPTREAKDPKPASPPPPLVDSQPPDPPSKGAAAP